MGFWDRLTWGWGPQPREPPPVPRVLNMLLDNARGYGAAWIELVVEERAAFRWDAPHEPLDGEHVSGIYYCVPEQSIVDALIPMIVHHALVEFTEEQCGHLEVSGEGATCGRLQHAPAGGPGGPVDVLVQRDHSGFARRLVLQIRAPQIDDALDLNAAVIRPEGPRPVRIDAGQRVRAVRPTKA